MIPIKTRHMILLFLGALAIAMAIFWYNYSALGYSLSDLTTFFLAKDSRVQERLIMQPGTSTGVSIVAGTQTDTWVGNPDDQTLPRIELDGATGEWKFKNRNAGTQSTNIGDVQSGSLSAYMEKNGGTLTNGILAGTTTLLSGSKISANGRSITDEEIARVDGLTDDITTLLSNKQDNLSGNYVASLSDDVGTLTGPIRFGVTGDLTQQIVTNKIIIGLNGTISAKPDVKLGTTTIVAGTWFLSFDESQYTLTPDATGVDIALSDSVKGTTSAVPNYTVKLDDAGRIAAGQLPQVMNSNAAVYTAATSTTSTSWQQIASLNVSITPGSTTSKILLMAAVSGVSGPTGHNLYRLTKNGTAISGALGDASSSRTPCTFTGIYNDAGSSIAGCMNYIDAPGTTTTIVYGVQWRPYSGSYQAHINRSSPDNDSDGYPRSISTLIALEIK